MKSPVAVLWNFTYWCNMNCIHCFSREEAKRSKNKEIDETQAKQIAEQIIEAEVLHVNFGGGEPLGRVDFFNIAENLVNGGVGISLSTNGWLVNDETAQFLKTLDIRSVSVSIHGSTRKIHDDFHRCTGAFNGAVNAIKTLLEKEIYTKIVTTVTRYNINDIANISKLANELQVNEFVLQSFKLPINFNKKQQDILIPKEDWKEIIKRFSDIKKNVNRERPKIHFDFLNDPVIAQILEKKSDCPCGKFTCTIKPNGELVPCPFVNIVAGSLLENSLINLWENSIIFKEIRNRNLNLCCDKIK
ncbi:hypothetical protein AMJ49_06860 [Parcubacteria bacterium DG_74_2]|nr:MAG: hypothetical protein AMJ49_06860 [Parcubacteria bacterium DG_74_2]